MIIEVGAQHLPPEGLYTTASMDSGPGNSGDSWYVKGFNLAYPTTGLPAAGSTVASAAALDHQYTFATNYAANDVVYVDAYTSGTMIWATPSSHSALSFLASAGHGPVIVDYTVNHDDGSTEDGSITIDDWFDGTPAAFTANGRVDVNSGTYDNIDAGNPRLYTADISLTNTVSAITSVSLSFDPNNADSTSVVVFFAVSGTVGSIAPVFVAEPVSFNTNLASTAQISAAVSGSGPLTYFWEKGHNGLFTNLTSAGRISGSTTNVLSITNVTYNDDGYYQLVVTNVAGSVTSSVVYLNVVSDTPVVTVASDPISIFNGSSPSAEMVPQAIDGTTSKYLNFGANSYPPFVGPVGLVVTPAMGSTVVTGLRLFTANDSPERDPADYLLEGSIDGGASFTTIATGQVTMPDDRNPEGLAIDPIAEFNREVSFPNQTAYTTYRFSVAHVKNDAIANSMQVGEVQLLGTASTGGGPVVISFANLGGGQMQLEWSQGTLQSADSVAGPYSTVPGASSPYVISTATGSQFYRVQVR
jgi:hypothetical protein